MKRLVVNGRVPKFRSEHTASIQVSNDLRNAKLRNFLLRKRKSFVMCLMFSVIESPSLAEQGDAPSDLRRSDVRPIDEIITRLTEEGKK